MNLISPSESRTSDFQLAPPEEIQPARSDFDEKRRKFHVFTVDELAEEIKRVGTMKYLVQGLIPFPSITVGIGESGIGKSPLLYQLGLCVAGGLPFLGMNVMKGPVLYADYENNVNQVLETVDVVARFLGLTSRPAEFLTWNANNASTEFGTTHYLLDIVRDIKPSLTIIDTLSAAFPDAEDTNKRASETWGQLRSVISAQGGTVVLSHHFNKERSDESVSTVMDVLRKARGASAIINGSDVRLAIAKPSATTFSDGQCAFEIAGLRRVAGEIPSIAVERVYQDSEPVGYRRLSGVQMLKNDHYQRVFESLPDEFRSKDVEERFPTSGSSAQAFLKACDSANITEKIGTGRYRKKNPGGNGETRELVM
jgi:archaellum biogenesis ATPase FlaH